MEKHGYLHCGHCGAEFLASKAQWEKSGKKQYEGRKFYCSPVCQFAGLSGPRGKPPKWGGVCRHCGVEFRSIHKGKIFCSMKCYLASDQLKEHLRGHAGNGGGPAPAGIQRPSTRKEFLCLHCGTAHLVKASDAKKRRFCNHRCYRAYMAGRYDRWIASPQSLALPQNYDEFMTQDELPCLIEGCGWVGKHLGSHVNLAHGIPVEEFKRAAGFNIGTGLVCPETAQALADRAHIHDPKNMIRAREAQNQIDGKPPGPPIGIYKSLEAKEHLMKGIALRQEFNPDLPARPCPGCGKDFEPGPLAHSMLYCTAECRDTHYKREKQSAKFPMQCAECGKEFQGSFYQQATRIAKSLPVYCAIQCRQLHNGRVGMETKKQKDPEAVTSWAARMAEIRRRKPVSRTAEENSAWAARMAEARRRKARPFEPAEKRAWPARMVDARRRKHAGGGEYENPASEK